MCTEKMRYTSLLPKRFLGKKLRDSCAKASSFGELSAKIREKSTIANFVGIDREKGQFPPCFFLIPQSWFRYATKSATQALNCAKVAHFESFIQILFTPETDNGHLKPGFGAATFADIFKTFFH